MREQTVSSMQQAGRTLQRPPKRGVSRLALAAFLCVAVWMAAGRAQAQLSFSSAIDLALKNSPKVKMAEADVARAKATVEEVHDAYVPSVVASSSGLGDSTGFPLGLPTVFSISAQSLVFSFSQKDYIRSAVAGLNAAKLALADVRGQVTEDAASSYVALSVGERRQAALSEERQYAARLAAIVGDRVAAGQDNAMDGTRARRTLVQLELALLQQQDTLASGADHLARLIGLPGTKIVSVPESIPAFLVQPVAGGPEQTGPEQTGPGETPGVAAAFANARSKREQAFGDARYTLRPQIAFGAQYSRFSTYNNNYATYYPGIQNQPNAFGLALDITLPFFDATHRAKARESLAEASRLESEAVFDQTQATEARLKLAHSVAEARARAELASLDRDLAAEQLQVVLVELNQAQSGNAPPTNPKDEQNAHIQERQRYVEMLDAELDLDDAEIHLLRQTGRLDQWIRAGVRDGVRDGGPAEIGPTGHAEATLPARSGAQPGVAPTVFP